MIEKEMKTETQNLREKLIKNWNGGRTDKAG